MTVTANTTRNDYTAGSAQSEYDYTFQLNEAADVDVYLDGVKQTLNTHYVVQNVGNASGGTIVFTLEDENGDPIHPTQGAIINIVMAMDLDRDTNYQPSGAFLAADVNNDFDRLWLATNQQQTAVNRALRLKDTDVTTSSMELPLKDDRKGKLLAFNATTGDPEATTNNQSNWDTAYNNSITSASFSGSTLTLGQQDGGTITASHTPYLPIAGGTLTGDLHFNDNDAIKFGDSNDLQIFHNGTSSIIQDSGTGDLALLGTNLAFANGAGTLYYAAGTEGGAFTLYYNGSEKLATTSGGISVTGTLTATGYNDSNWNAAYNDKINSASFDTSNGVLTLTQQDGGTVTVDLDGRYSTDTGIALGDNQKATFGDSNDLEIYHDGSNSYVKDTGTGYLILGNSDAGTIIKNGSGQNLLTTTASEIRLGHEGNTKLATKSTGIDVTGTATMDGLISHTGSNATDIASLSGSALGRALKVQSYDTTLTGAGFEINASASAGEIKLQTATKDRLRVEATGDISFYEDTGATPKFFWDASAERLGIGTSSPDRALHVSTSDNLPVFVESTDGLSLLGIGDSSGSVAVAANGSSFSVYTGGSVGGDTSFGSERMRIDSSGKVGIGTTSPIRALDVRGGTTDIVANFESSDAGGYISLQDNTTSSDTAVLVGAIGDALRIDTGDTESLRIDSSGRVGIGTSSPSEELHISSSVPKARLQDSDGTNQYGEFYHSAGTTAISARNNTTDGTIVFQKNDGTTTDETMRIDSSGNVGIGITSPQNTLDIKGTGGATSGFAVRNSSEIVKGYFANDNADSDFLLTYVGSSSAEVKLKHNGNVVLCESAGNVGINKTNPSTALDVSGTITATDYAGDGSTLTGVLSDVIDDTTPQLGGTLDANDKEIQNVQNIGIGFSGDVNYNIQVEDSKAATNIEMMRIKNTGSYNGRVMTFYRGTNLHGNIGTSTIQYGQGVYVSSGNGGLKFQNQFTTTVVEPCGVDGADYDNAVDLGRSNNRFDDIYATNSTIQTSDRNLKQDIESLTDAEQRVAVAAKGLLRKFRWIDAVEEKGDDARIHFGIIAQDLQDAFTAEGLDSSKYAMFCSNTWWEHEGEKYYEADHAPEGATEVTRLGVRYSELLAFIISVI